MPKPLNRADIEIKLSDLNGWHLEGGARTIAKRFIFDDFIQAFAFMTRIADVADAMNHHPDWANVYNRVDVRLSTHDAGGLTDKDFALAQSMDAIVPTH
ncbi:4a-hydroxytetrahydrobiopterin dehydratase [Pseudomonadota bacterium]